LTESECRREVHRGQTPSEKALRLPQPDAPPERGESAEIFNESCCRVEIKFRFACVCCCDPLITAAETVDTSAVAKTVKSDVAQLVAGLNAHDAFKTTAYDDPDVVSMECGSPSTIGIEADRQGFKAGFAHDPLWRVSLIDEIVDVASSGDLAVYRGTYNEDNGRAGAVMTRKTTFIAEFKRQNDGSWKIVWYSAPFLRQNRCQ
jgi:ketosteroid isomerase-like protein